MANNNMILSDFENWLDTASDEELSTLLQEVDAELAQAQMEVDMELLSEDYLLPALDSIHVPAPVGFDGGCYSPTHSFSLAI